MSHSARSSAKASITDSNAVQDGSSEFTDAELMRYSRQILLPGWDIDAQLRLKNARVLVVGAGGLGCAALSVLSRAGAGHIVILDNDEVEDSNLQRQLLFGQEDVGQNKALAAARKLVALSPWQHIEGRAESLQQFIQVNSSLAGQQSSASPLAGFDLILDCTDNFDTRYLINRLSIQFAVPYIMASAIGFAGQLACFSGQPGTESACYACLFPPSSDSHAGNNCETCAESGVLSSAPVVMGTLQANAALTCLGLGQLPLAGQLLLWDGLTMQQKIVGFSKDPSCKICASML